MPETVAGSFGFGVTLSTNTSYLLQLISAAVVAIIRKAVFKFIV